jgi:hypothetical protein
MHTVNWSNTPLLHYDALVSLVPGIVECSREKNRTPLATDIPSQRLPAISLTELLDG